MLMGRPEELSQLLLQEEMDVVGKNPAGKVEIFQELGVTGQGRVAERGQGWMGAQLSAVSSDTIPASLQPGQGHSGSSEPIPARPRCCYQNEKLGF